MIEVYRLKSLQHMKMGKNDTLGNNFGSITTRIFFETDFETEYF